MQDNCPQAKMQSYFWFFILLHGFPDLSYATLFCTRCLTPFELRELHANFLVAVKDPSESLSTF